MARIIDRRIIVVLMLALVPATAAADTINFMGSGKSAVVNITSPTLGDITVRAGELLWSAGSPSELPLLFYAYCVDPNTWLAASDLIAIRPSSELDTAWVLDAGDKAAWLINTYAPSVHDTGSGLDAAALQIAIWGVMYNESGNLTDGPFRLRSTGTIATMAQGLLNSVYTGPTGVNHSNAAWLDAASGQDQMIPTPEPGTFLLMGTGLAAAWRMARRKREE